MSSNKKNRKIAVTADLHLREEEDYSNRYDTFIKILDSLKEKGIDKLIVAGDVFDKDYSNYRKFEEICSNEKYRNINFHIIPGNHDPELKDDFFTADNISVYSKTQLVSLDEEFDFLFVPYLAESVMGDEAVKNKPKDTNKKWVLVGHGDYIEGKKIPNPYEEGVYMPLTKADTSRLQFSFVFLGHIHKPTKKENLYYPGSPYPLHRNEEGLRRIVVFDPEKEKVEELNIETDVVYYNEKITLLPFTGKQEEGYIKQELDKVINNWSLSGEDLSKVELNLLCSGYITTSKNDVKKVIKTHLQDKVQEVTTDLSAVSITTIEPEKEEVLLEINKKINKLSGDEEEIDEDYKKEVLKHALKTIYER